MTTNPQHQNKPSGAPDHTGDLTPTLQLVLRSSLVVLFALVAVIVGLIIYRQSLNFFLSYDVTDLQGFAILPSATPDPSTPEPGETPAPTNAPTDPGSGAPIGGPEALPWDGASPVTILVMGVDYGDWSKDRTGPSRTDTMILFTVDPLSNSIGMLNIPRDLWVQIPGYYYAKLNTAYYLGELHKLPDGGPGLAIRTVEELIGVPINFYAQIDFYSFEKFIDTIGGIEVEVPAEVSIDPLGPLNNVTLQPGLHSLDGALALAYARARYTEGGDFDRADRQQQVILAIRKKVLDPQYLPDLIAKAPQIYQDLSSGIHTNMTFEQAMQLALLVKDIPLDQIRRAVIAPPDGVLFSKSPDGTQDILIPVPENIRRLRDYVFSGESAFKPALSETSLIEVVQREAARIKVVNATATEKLATRTQEYLITQGVNVIEIGNSPELLVDTLLIDYTGNPYTLSYLRELFQVNRFSVIQRYDPNSPVDIEIVLGAAWVNTNPMP
jgi:LCP family protein required for cell wall assembly